MYVGCLSCRMQWQEEVKTVGRFKVMYLDSVQIHKTEHSLLTSYVEPSLRS
jgi:hypothetical protein